MPQMAKAAHARAPSRRRGPSPAAPGGLTEAGPAAHDALEPDDHQRNHQHEGANSDAASRSKVPRQMRKTPTVTVSTPKYWTVRSR